MSPKTVHRVCPRCANNLPYCKAYKRCRHCGLPMNDEKANLCRDCMTKRSYTTRVTSAFLYDGAAKKAVLAFKREENASNAGELAMYIAGMVKSDFGGVDFDFVVAVPPRIKEYDESKFDQAAYLAKKVSLRLGIPYLKGAMRQTKKVKKQSSLSRGERMLNLVDVFAVVKTDSLKDKTVLLIDDVTTTGTTLEECAKVLKKSGVYRVYAATAAKTPYAL